MGSSSNQMTLVSNSGNQRVARNRLRNFRNDARDASILLPRQYPSCAVTGPEAYGFVVGGPVMLPGYDGRNRMFLPCDDEGRESDCGATNLLHGADAGAADGKRRHADHHSVKRAVPEHTIRSHASAPATGLTLGRYPAPNSTAAQGNYQAGAHVSAGPGPVHVLLIAHPEFGRGILRRYEHQRDEQDRRICSGR